MDVIGLKLVVSGAILVAACLFLGEAITITPSDYYWKMALMVFTIAGLLAIPFGLLLWVWSP